MSPGRVWVLLSLIALGSIAVVCLVLLWAGLALPPTATIGMAACVAYGYILYKRYRVEVVPESDLKLFDDIDDLRILCGIYGLDATGGETRLRQRLGAFARANQARTFVWVLPRSLSWTAAKDAPLTSTDLAVSLLDDSKRGPRRETRPLVNRGAESAKRTRLKICPICDARAPLTGTICRSCGADLSFYVALSESRIGRRLVDQKATTVRRKLRYDAASIRGQK